MQKSTVSIALLAALLVAVGCTPFKSSLIASNAAGDAALAAPITPASAGVAEAVPVGPRPEKMQQQAMAEVAPMLAKIATADPELHAETLDQLGGTTPNLWSLTVQRAEQTLAYRQQLLAEQTPETQPTRIATTRTSAPAAPAQVTQASASLDDTGATLPQIVGGAPAAPMIANAYATERPTEPEPAEAIALTPPEVDVEVEESKTWREHLASAIATLDETAAARPRSKREAYERVRLQMLQLVAGETDDAVVSTPGLSSAEQGYWSNQLYAISTLLDNRGADDQATADEAARHQAEATTKLQTLGSLQVRNFVTCREVYDYGAYTPYPEARYAPGEKVTLYAEIENYKSEATADGYQTTLSSSYRLVDRHGDEVSAGDIPKVDDLCLTRRRDFHIEYRVSLPAGLSAGEYTLHLTVHDQLGDKLGHAEAPLTVSLR